MLGDGGGGMVLTMMESRSIATFYAHWTFKWHLTKMRKVYVFVLCILSVLFFHRVNFFTSTLFLDFNIYYMDRSLFFCTHTHAHTQRITYFVRHSHSYNHRQKSKTLANAKNRYHRMGDGCAHVWHNNRIDCVTMNDRIYDNVVVRTDCLPKIDRAKEKKTVPW